ncbi:MAG TPA: biopolymer transporter ExbD [Steroidobacteraceae bacterium]|nr:biopolymer transporter ExbD [Steroidobacteraceae bacterium]
MKLLGLGLMPHKRRERVDAQLNLIPLIDILSVMVAFLLVYSTDVEVLQNPKGVSIPESRTDARPKQSVVVMVTKEALLVQGETVASFAEVSDPRTKLIEPLRRVLQRPMAGLDTAARDAALNTQEVTVMADKDLPYEVLRKVLATCTAASYGKISLAVMQKEQPVSMVKGS